MALPPGSLTTSKNCVPALSDNGASFKTSCAKTLDGAILESYSKADAGTLSVGDEGARLESKGSYIYIYERFGSDGSGELVARRMKHTPSLHLPIVFSEGVVKGRIDAQQFVALTSTNAAKLFGVYPQKGTISIGADADICIWDAEKKVTITQEMLHHDTDYTPYEGMAVTGWPTTTISRGEVLWQDGAFKAAPGRGRFMARGPYDFIKPRGVFPGPFKPFD